MKNLYDRFFPLMDVDGKPRFGTKKLITVWAQSMDDVTMYDSYYEYTAAMYPSFGFEWVDNIVCPNANDPESADRDAELKPAPTRRAPRSRAEKAGAGPPAASVLALSASPAPPAAPEGALPVGPL